MPTAGSGDSILIPLLLAGWRLETQVIEKIFFVLFITPRYGLRRKSNLSIVKKACLERCCIATEVIRLLLAYSAS
jgi:hypothetical protein